MPSSREYKEVELKKILSIDGGGIKGVFPAAFLAEIEEKLGEPIIDYFRPDRRHVYWWNHCPWLGPWILSSRNPFHVYEDNAEKYSPQRKDKDFGDEYFRNL